MKIKLDVSLGNKDFESIIRKYHFRTIDFDDLKALYRAIFPLIDSYAYYNYNFADQEIDYAEYVSCFITLGNSVDKIQTVYMDKELIMESYMIDCLASELLVKAYKQFVKYIEENSGKFVLKLDFLGDKYPVEMVSKLYEQDKPENISYNSCYQLSPSKTVTILLPLSEHKPENNVCNTCYLCKNMNCTIRENPSVNQKAKQNPTYGNMAIFGL